MKKVLMIGSAARSLVNFRGELIKEITDLGHSVYVCSPDIDSLNEDIVSLLGVQVVPMHLNRTGVNPFSDLFSVYHLYKKIKQLKPDIVLSYTIKPVVYGTICSYFAGVKHISAMVTGLGYSFIGKGFKKTIVRNVAKVLYKISLRLCDCVIFHNSDDVKLFQELGLLSDKIDISIVNGSGVNMEKYTRQPLGGKPIILLVARLLIDKGIREFAGAARIVKGKYPEAEFRLVGPVDDHPNAISRSELDGWIDAGIIRYVGQVDDVRKELAGCKVFVLPSYREGTPRSTLEALSVGRPIVTTDAPGCRETVEHGKNGFIVPVRDVSQLAAAIEKLICDTKLCEKMAEESYLIAKNKYAVEKVNEAMLKNMGLKE